MHRPHASRSRSPLGFTNVVCKSSHCLEAIDNEPVLIDKPIPFQRNLFDHLRNAFDSSGPYREEDDE